MFWDAVNNQTVQQSGERRAIFEEEETGSKGWVLTSDADQKSNTNTDDTFDKTAINKRSVITSDQYHPLQQRSVCGRNGFSSTPQDPLAYRWRSPVFPFQAALLKDTNAVQWRVLTQVKGCYELDKGTSRPHWSRLVLRQALALRMRNSELHSPLFDFQVKQGLHLSLLASGWCAGASAYAES